MIKVQFACGCLMTITECARDKYAKNYICPVHGGKEKTAIYYYCIECGIEIIKNYQKRISGNCHNVRCEPCKRAKNIERATARNKIERELNKISLSQDFKPKQRRTRKKIIGVTQNKADCEHYDYCLSKYAHDREWQHKTMPCKHCQKYKKGSLDIMNHAKYESDACSVDYRYSISCKKPKAR
ncbi:MAG: hypothetical protein HQK63_06360 [Desulfamplus sp.]|nr:hypothetical protein [Desulfamplus sp.]